MAGSDHCELPGGFRDFQPGGSAPAVDAAGAGNDSADADGLVCGLDFRLPGDERAVGVVVRVPNADRGGQPSGSGFSAGGVASLTVILSVSGRRILSCLLLSI